VIITKHLSKKTRGGSLIIDGGGQRSESLILYIVRKMSFIVSR
jgi:hypothetical protein